MIGQVPSDKLVSAMEQRRFLVFLILSMTVSMAWFNFVGPALFPNAFPKPRIPQPQDLKLSHDDQDAAPPVDALHPANVIPMAAKNVAQADLPKHPPQEIFLGPTDAETNPNEQADFFVAANLTSRGAAIDAIELTDKKRYPAFGHRGKRIQVVGSDALTPLKTFSLQCPQIDSLLDSSSLDQISWEVVPEPQEQAPQRAVTFRIVSPDQHWQLTKRFELRKLTPAELEQREVAKELVDGYEVKLTITIRNLTNQSQSLSYSLLGPVGTPLEDVENSYKYRDLRMGFLRDDGNVDESKLSAAETVKKQKNDQTPEWKRKIKYIGVDVLYFAALVLPGADQVDSAKALVADESRVKPDYSDISFQLKSQPLTIDGQSEIAHEYRLFAGPKLKSLIAKVPAMAVMDYGWFDSICRGMVWLLNSLHGLGLSYGLAIVCLTALVRTLLMPISKHQAANAAKMKVLQPKIMAKQKELEAKYGKNTEEYMKHAQELSKEQFGLMMSGCLPAFLQLPIFIALYRAIGSSIELRMEPFLWFENLASPDALFKLPFIVPWLGWTHFNLLPCISTGLMFMHQKMTAPPPTNEEQVQQQKMMSYMMIFMGAMFFRVPSGLCLYFIATNIWSMTERWLFEHWKSAPPSEELAIVGVSSEPPKSPAAARKPDDGTSTAFGGIWNRLQEAADNQRTVSKQLDNSASNRNDKKKKKR